MRITCKKDDLFSKLDLVSRVAARNAALPILQCVHIEATKQGIELSATNLELGVKAALPGEVVEPGAAAVPASVFLATISLLSGAPVSLRLEDGVLIVESRGSLTKIKTLPPDDFPPIHTLDAKAAGMNGAQLALGMKAVLFAVSQSNIKPELASVNIRQKEAHTLTFVATDSFRLAEKTVAVEGAIIEGSLLVPGKNAAEIVRILEALGENPLVSYTENQLALSFPSGVYLSSRLTEGNFPDYEQIIPKEFQTHAAVLVSDLEHALKKTNIFTNKFLQVSIAVDPKKGAATLSAENTDAGTTSETIRAEVEGEALALSFNQNYLHDPIAHFTDESVRLSFAGVGRPLVFRGVHADNFRYLVMPMNK